MNVRGGDVKPHIAQWQPTAEILILVWEENEDLKYF